MRDVSPGFFEVPPLALRVTATVPLGQQVCAEGRQTSPITLERLSLPLRRSALEASSSVMRSDV